MVARRKSAPARRNSGTRGRANAISLLSADHARVMQLFQRFENARGAQKQRIARDICNELTVHAQLEEEIFYPAARDAIGADDLMDEAEVEHASAKELIAQIEAGSPGDALWEAKVSVLGEHVRHHVKEEQGKMFKKIRASQLDLNALGDRIRARKARLMGVAKRARKTLAGLWNAL